MNKSTNLYKRYRFPPEIIQYSVWLYHRFNLCGSRKAMSLDYIEDFTTIGHPLIQGSLAPLYRLVVHLQPSESSLPTVGGHGATTSALRVPVPAAPTTYCSG